MSYSIELANHSREEKTSEASLGTVEAADHNDFLEVSDSIKTSTPAKDKGLVPPASKKLLSCSQCSYETSYRFNLKRHSECHNDKTFLCDDVDCNKTFSSAQSHNRHKRTHSQSAPVEILICNSCAKEYKSKKGLDYHMKKVHSTCSPGKKIVCPFPLCNKEFYSRYHYKGHMNSHTNQTLYNCDTCEKHFGYKSNLSAHKKICKNEKQYQCITCEKFFCSSRVFREHVDAKHMNKKQYFCRQCNKAFS